MTDGCEGKEAIEEHEHLPRAACYPQPPQPLTSGVNVGEGWRQKPGSTPTSVLYSPLISPGVGISPGNWNYGSEADWVREMRKGGRGEDMSTTARGAGSTFSDPPSPVPTSLPTHSPFARPQLPRPSNSSLTQALPLPIAQAQQREGVALPLSLAAILTLVVHLSVAPVPGSM